MITSLSKAPILLQYLFFLTMNTLATFAHHLTVRILVRVFLSQANEQSTPVATGSPDKEAVKSGAAGSDGSTTPQSIRTVGPGHASPSAISTALLVSSCTKLFPILLVIWPTDVTDSENTRTLSERSTPNKASFSSRARSYVGWAVLLNNIEALLILLDCGYPAAVGLAVAGAFARWVVEATMLGAVGMTSLDGNSGPIGFFIWFLIQSCRRIGLVS